MMPAWVEQWFTNIREVANLEVEQIPLTSSKSWSIINGSLVHTTGRFFQVSAVHWIDPNNETFFQPLLVQQEIGILGFAISEGHILLQAKVEPGNVGQVQIAPTCQATASNLDQIHGGKKPPFAKFFEESNQPFIFSSLQSEQGTRFFQKFNNNILLEMDCKVQSDTSYQWQPIDAITELMDADFLINTDARSVLMTCPWETLVNRKPFTRFSEPFSKELSMSYDDDSEVDNLYQDINALRKTINKPHIKTLAELPGWDIGDLAITPQDKQHYEIIQINIKANNREVTTWDQPILSSFGEGYVELVCGRKNNLLHFLFSYQIEPGLTNFVELGPSFIIEPGDENPGTSYTNIPGASMVAEFKQSDEGGRFYKDVTLYRLVDIGEVREEAAEGTWLTLGQIRKLLSSGSWFTNEARSMLSVLLKWV